MPRYFLPNEDAYGEEVNLFLHVHLRGYDRNGDGRTMDAAFYDQYGAPIMRDNSWMEGYHAVEEVLNKHYNICHKVETFFPKVAGMGGGAHLYKRCNEQEGHDDKPWNWTGWIPLQKRWLSGGQFFSNRKYLAIRGNEIQNNAWDYCPHDEAADVDTDDEVWTALTPTDKYHGGYWYQNNAFARYLHIISLKAHLHDKNLPTRYNFIVHPLAYRESLNALPDNSVDAMQWSIINIENEDHFKDDDKWGNKVHALEIFNDFTYFHTWNPTFDDGDLFSFHNGGLLNGDIYWFNTYPLEYGVFLLDTALTRGVYLQILTANDAFYQKKGVPDDIEGMDPKDKESIKNLLADPKAGLIKKQKTKRPVESDDHTPPSKVLRIYETEKTKKKDCDEKDEALKVVLDFYKERPYGLHTAFGYCTLIDTDLKMKNLVFPDESKGDELNRAEQNVIDYLVKGQFFSHTGAYNLFNYKNVSQRVPFIIRESEDDGRKAKRRKKEENSLCYELTENMDLVFTFPPCQEPFKIGENCFTLTWQYTIQTSKRIGVETTRGYFKLSTKASTVLNLSNYDKHRVRWIRFTAFMDINPQRRAYFNPIKGLSFKEDAHGIDGITRETNGADGIVQETNRIAETVSTITDSNTITITEKNIINPHPCKNKNFIFEFPRAISEDEEDDIYVYFLQVCALQQNLTLEETKESSSIRPPRYLQNVHGYFKLNEKHPTKIDFNQCWDSKTVKDGIVYFYRIDNKTGQPKCFSKVNAV